jgi:hypothetical protein
MNTRPRRRKRGLVPPKVIGRLLNLEAAKIIRRIERGMPKRPAAASVSDQSGD